MTVNIQTKYTKNPIAALKDGKLDLAVIMSDISKSQFHVQELFSDELQIFVSSHHPLAKQKNLTLKDLEGAGIRYLWGG
jgi:DNA-binding transcriptional LysR family regulator